MAKLTVQDVTRSGLNPSYQAAAAGGDSFANNGETFFHAKNANTTTARTVTIASQVTDPPPGTAAQDVAVSIPASGERMIGPFPVRPFNDADGLVQVTYSTEADLTVAAIGV